MTVAHILNHDPPLDARPNLWAPIPGVLRPDSRAI